MAHGGNHALMAAMQPIKITNGDGAGGVWCMGELSEKLHEKRFENALFELRLRG
jgi:hypothetical protein